MMSDIGKTLLPNKRQISLSKPGAYGKNSHSEGKETTAFGPNSHAEGELTVAGGESSHAEGLLTQAQAFLSRSYGLETVAEGDISMASGYKSRAVGPLSNAYGDTNSAFGYGATSFGRFNLSVGDLSTTFGWGGMAKGDGSFIGGVKADYDFCDGSVSSAASNNSSYKENGFIFGEQSVSFAINSTIFGKGNASIFFPVDNDISGSFIAGKNCYINGETSASFGDRNVGEYSRNSLFSGQLNGSFNSSNISIFGKKNSIHESQQTSVGGRYNYSYEVYDSEINGEGNIAIYAERSIISGQNNRIDNAFNCQINGEGCVIGNISEVSLEFEGENHNVIMNENYIVKTSADLVYAHVYRINPDLSFTLIASLRSPYNGWYGEGMGHGMSINDNNVLVIGCYNETGTTGSNYAAGATYFYKITGDTVTFKSKHTNAYTYCGEGTVVFCNNEYAFSFTGASTYNVPMGQSVIWSWKIDADGNVSDYLETLVPNGVGRYFAYYYENVYNQCTNIDNNTIYFSGYDQSSHYGIIRRDVGVCTFQGTPKDNLIFFNGDLNKRSIHALKNLLSDTFTMNIAPCYRLSQDAWSKYLSFTSDRGVMFYLDLTVDSPHIVVGDNPNTEVSTPSPFLESAPDNSRLWKAVLDETDFSLIQEYDLSESEYHFSLYIDRETKIDLPAEAQSYLYGKRYNGYASFYSLENSKIKFLRFGKLTYWLKRYGMKDYSLIPIENKLPHKEVYGSRAEGESTYVYGNKSIAVGTGEEYANFTNLFVSTQTNL